jgi:hypothetical protein
MRWDGTGRSMLEHARAQGQQTHREKNSARLLVVVLSKRDHRSSANVEVHAHTEHRAQNTI